MDTKEFIQEFANKYLANSHLSITNIELEDQNKEYCGARFIDNNHTIRFRKAKVTPTKCGLFVVAWEKDENNINQPYEYSNAPEYLMIYIEKEEHKGLFIFHRDILLRYKILSLHKQKGKMGFRVYPPWEEPNNQQALATQKWQSPHYIALNDKDLDKTLTFLFAK